jgi:hypothetical protein
VRGLRGGEEEGGGVRSGPGAAVTIRASSILDPPLLPLRFRSTQAHAHNCSESKRALSCPKFTNPYSIISRSQISRPRNVILTAAERLGTSYRDFFIPLVLGPQPRRWYGLAVHTRASQPIWTLEHTVYWNQVCVIKYQQP